MSSSPEVFHPPPHSDLEVSSPGHHTVTMADKFYSDRPQEAVPPQYFYATPDGQARKERTMCGVRPATFFLSLALVLVILAAAIGGGVGGTMAVNNAKSENKDSDGTAISTVTITTTAPPSTGTIASASASASSTSTSTSASTIGIPTSGTVALDCPNINNTELRMTLVETSVFTIVCGRDYPGAKNDILALTVYSLADCARACASYNRNSGSSDCKGAAFKSDLTANVPVNFGNCWLKNNTQSPSAGSSDGLAALVLND